MNESITFLLPSNGLKPAGGYKVVYEYANRFVQNGFDVYIAYSTITTEDKPFYIKNIKSFLVYIYRKLNGYSCRKWFNLDHRVKEIIIPQYSYRFMPKTNYYVATAVHTSYTLINLPISNSRKYYLIQGFENWSASDKYVYDSYKLGLNNIVISSWLEKVVKKETPNCTLIKNGFDFEYFSLIKPVEDKNKYTISMLYHHMENKGAKYGIEAVKLVKRKYPELRVLLFGVPPRPSDLPNWIEYYQKPDRDLHNRIYNESAIYLAPSLQEGWGLTIGEAMICGAAIVCTDTLGFHEMIEHNKTALVSPIKDSVSLANNIISLIEDDSKRISMAKSGNEYIKQFDWDSSFQKFKSLIWRKNHRASKPI